MAHAEVREHSRVHETETSRVKDAKRWRRAEKSSKNAAGAGHEDNGQDRPPQPARRCRRVFRSLRRGVSGAHPEDMLPDFSVCVLDQQPRADARRSDRPEPSRLPWLRVASATPRVCVTGRKARSPPGTRSRGWGAPVASGVRVSGDFIGPCRRPGQFSGDRSRQ